MSNLPRKIFESFSGSVIHATLFLLQFNSLNKFISKAERPEKVKVTSCKPGIRLKGFREPEHHLEAQMQKSVFTVNSILAPGPSWGGQDSKQTSKILVLIYTTLFCNFLLSKVIPFLYPFRAQWLDDPFYNLILKPDISSRLLH